MNEKKMPTRRKRTDVQRREEAPARASPGSKAEFATMEDMRRELEKRGLILTERRGDPAQLRPGKKVFYKGRICAIKASKRLSDPDEPPPYRQASRTIPQGDLFLGETRPSALHLLVLQPLEPESKPVVPARSSPGTDVTPARDRPVQVRQRSKTRETSHDYRYGTDPDNDVDFHQEVEWHPADEEDDVYPGSRRPRHLPDRAPRAVPGITGEGNGIRPGRVDPRNRKDVEMVRHVLKYEGFLQKDRDDEG